jgi:polyisoprenoid-binding protein YceI
MSRGSRIIIGIVAVVVILAGGGLLWFFSQGDGTASQDISQVVSTLAPTSAPATDVPPTSAPAADAEATAVVGAGAVVEVTETVAQGAANTDAETEAVVFQIVSEESEARFYIDEVLMGNPFEVVGTTDQVGGQMRIDFANPSASQIGEIVVNVRTLATDNSNRDRAMRGMILGTDDPANEFARFLPTALTGLPENIAFGESITFTIAGDLTLKSATRPVTFDATVTPVSADRIEGIASLVIDYVADFGITIPMLPPSVASVEDVARLEIEFVAAPAAS